MIVSFVYKLFPYAGCCGFGIPKMFESAVDELGVILDNLRKLRVREIVEGVRSSEEFG